MYKKLFERVKKANFIAVVPHTRPDGDAIGSSLGLHHALEFNGFKSIVVCKDEISRKLQFIAGCDKIKKEIPNGCDLVISVDTAAVERVGADTRDLEIVVIDHHLSNHGFGTFNVIEPDFASTGEVVYKFLKINDLKINRPCAKAVYAAIFSDTRTFTTPRVNASTFEAVSDLVRCGANIQETTNNLKHSMGLSEMRLFGEALKSFEVVGNGKFTVCVITSEMLKNCGAVYSDTEDIADFLLGNVTAVATCLIIEKKAGGTKASFRSKGGFNVLNYAKQFGGGGHVNASGFDTDLSPMELKEKIIEVLSA